MNEDIAKKSLEEKPRYYKILNNQKLEENNKLLYEERRMLILYRQLLRKEYDVDDNSIYEVNNEFRNHIEMQKAIYLAYKLLWTNEYVFFWDTYGPKSFELEARIKELDKKRKDILDYYSSFDSNIYSQDTINKLNNFYEFSKLKKLESFTKLTSNILEIDKGIELLADLTYIGSKELPETGFKEVNRFLQKVRPIFNNNELNEFAYRCLEEYNLINPKESSRGKVKRIEN